MKKKILVTTGTRAEYGILRPLLYQIKKSKKLELLLVVTGTHLSKKHGYTIKEIQHDGFKINAKFKMSSKIDNNFYSTIELAKGIISFTKVFQKLKPDINVLLGDRDEMFASAIAAFHMNIPNAHIHGGDKSGGLDEYIRHSITKLSNLHFAGTEKSKKRIILMGENQKYVFNTGSLSIDEVKSKKITSKKKLEKKYKISFTGTEIILLQHPVTTQPNLSEKEILNTLNAVTKMKNNVIAIVPNSDVGSSNIIRQLKRYAKKYSQIKLYTTIPRSDYLGMLQNCGVLVGNSSSGLIEASYFDIPVVNIGIRQKNRERGANAFDVDSNSSTKIYNTILQAYKKRPFIKKGKSIYGKGNASRKIVTVLEKIKIVDNFLQKNLTY